MNIDYLTYALNNLRTRKMRTWLTILSILIGIAAIFTLVSFGQGLSSYVEGLASEMGTDKIMATGGASFLTGIDPQFYFTEEEVGILKKLKGVKEISSVSLGGVQVTKDKKVIYAFGIAWDPSVNRQLVEEVMTIDILDGRVLKGSDRLKVTLGYNYGQPDKIFKRPVRIGQKLDINGQSFEVMGMYESVGNPQDDSNVYFTLEGYDLLFPDEKDTFYEIIIRTNPGVVPSEVAERAEDKIRRHRDLKVGEENFQIQTFEQALQTFTAVLAVINAILVLIALISLIIAGVNIMNTMYTAVLERTNEIGVMKAIGAQNRDILIIMVIESGLLGTIGGIIGVLIGWGLSSLGGNIAANAGYSLLQPAFPAWLVLGCIGFGLFIGMVAGYLPSRAASKLKPVDALRYE